MGYIGNEAQTAFTSFDKQTITGTNTAVYTLSHSVANEQEIEVFVNNVRQEGGSGKAYTVSGNQITFTENIASTDEVYVNFQGKAVQTVSHPSDQPLQATTGNFSSNVDVGGSLLVDTIKEGTGTNTAMTIDSSGIITPSNPVLFHIYMNANTGLPNASGVTLPLQAAEFATHSFHDTTNNRITVPSGHSGYLFLSWNVRIDALNGDNNAAYLRKNGTIIVEQNKYYTSAAAESISFTGSRVVSYTAGDYFDLYCFQDNPSSATRNAIAGTQNTFLSGFKIG